MPSYLYFSLPAPGQAGLHVRDLFADLSDGVALLRLLEVLSGETVGRPNRGVLRVQRVENVARALRFLAAKRVPLENIGPEDIVDGNERLILGLVWTLILRFQIQSALDITDTSSVRTRHCLQHPILLPSPPLTSPLRPTITHISPPYRTQFYIFITLIPY